jgi:hypothetical protein
MPRRLPDLCPFLLAVVLVGVNADASGDPMRERHLGRDTFVAGDEVVLRDEIEGDALAAGGRVTLDGRVGGDAVVAGANVDLDGSVANDLYAAGGLVRIASSVSGSARVAGGEVRLVRQASIADGLTVAAGRIAIEGRVGGYALLTGGSVVIDGEIDGDVRVAGGELRIGPNAVIDGSIIYRGPQPAQIDRAATIRGPMRNILYAREGWQRWWLTAIVVFALVWFIGWAIVGSLLLGLFPHATRRVTGIARTRPWLAVLIGFVALVVMPVVIALLLVTLVGIPLALVVMLVYLALLPLGFLAGAATISDWLLQRPRGAAAPPGTGWRIALFVLVLLAVTILAQVPFIGWFAGLLLWMLGIGAILLFAGLDTAQPSSRLVG